MTAAMVVVGVGGRRSAAQWAVSLASASSQSDRLARVCGGTVDTMNIGSRATVCPILILRCVRGDPLLQERQAPPIKACDGGPSIWRDHLPYILPLDLHISS
jgi:hypothetical protein